MVMMAKSSRSPRWIIVGIVVVTLFIQPNIVCEFLKRSVIALETVQGQELTHYTAKTSTNFMFTPAGEKQLTCCKEQEIGQRLCGIMSWLYH